MIAYYTATSVLLWLALGVLCVLVREDERVGLTDRHLHYATYGIIAAALLAEWGAVIFSGMPNVPALAIRAIKCFDYVLTPMAGGAMTAQMKIRNRWDNILVVILGANTLLQVVSVFTGWMVDVDAGVGYSHGPLYNVYAGIYIAILVLVVIQFLQYGKSFHRENRMSLYTSAGLVIVGILMQEILGSGIRTAYIGLTLGAVLLYIHSTEFIQQRTDDRIRQQQRQITTDALTGTRSRHAYARILESFAQKDEIPESLVVFSIDANGLKEVNDTFGHDAGDEMLCGAASCITKVFSRYGSCYRVGGDEFVVIANMTRPQADKCMQKLEIETCGWTGESINGISLSAGYAMAADHEGVSCEELVNLADERMYAAKAEYYRQSGHDRRRRRDTD